MNRVPPDFTEAPLHVAATTARRTHRSASDRAATRPAAARAGQDDSLDQTTDDGSQRVEMYDPYDPASSDSEYEKNHNNSSPDQDYNPGQQCSSPSRDFRKKRRWASCYSDSVTVHDRSPESTQSDRLSPGHRPPERPVYSLHGEDQPGYDSISRPLALLERLIHASSTHASSTQQFPVSYGGQRADGEERNTFTEYKREMNATVGSSPTRLQPDYQQFNYLGTEWNQVPPSTKVPRSRSINVIMDKRPITCDLCDVELANGQELEDHLESKSHWDTLEHIQQQHHYDDMAIAFLQEVMLYKSQQCSRAIEDGAAQALQENDHMTKIEMFQCAACRALVSTSASSVHIHITSQEHLTNIKEFQVQQRRSCLDKAETMMKELKPQYEHFLKGGSPFE